MNLALICTRDNCNRTAKMVRAIETVEGVQVRGLTERPHPFGYDKQLELGTVKGFKSLIAWADVVWLTMGNVKLHKQYEKHIKGKKLIVTHTGSKYRLNSKAYNDYFNPIANGHILLGHDHMKLGAVNSRFNSLRIVEPTPKPKRHKGAVKFGHFPSNPKKKGTDAILSVLKQLGVDYTVSAKTVSHKANLQRMADCDVYIDQLMPTMNGIVFGESGNQTYEALSLGCITVSNMTDTSHYKARHGEPNFIVANSTEQLYATLSILNELPKAEVERVRLDSWKAVQHQHGYEAMGLSIIQTVNEVIG